MNNKENYDPEISHEIPFDLTPFLPFMPDK
jgi:hypothetical protein